MNKRGQFYLVAAIIIVTIIVGFVSITNYVKKGETVLIKEVSEELSIETQKVQEYEVVAGEDKMNDYALTYSEHIGDSIELYLITGISPNINANKYLNGEVTSLNENLEVDKTTEKIIFTLYGEEYEFNLVEGENFYYIVYQEIKGESFVSLG